MLIAEPNTVVPTRDIRIDSSLLSPTSRFRKIIRRIRRTMNEVPETGSIPVSPITLTAMAPSRKVVDSSTTENISEGNTGYPPMTKMTVIATSEIAMKMGMWYSGHSYQPFPSTYSSPCSPEKACVMSPKIPMNVGAILNSPRNPPPRIAPIATVRIIEPKACHWTMGPISVMSL